MDYIMKFSVQNTSLESFLKSIGNELVQNNDGTFSLFAYMESDEKKLRWIIDTLSHKSPGNIYPVFVSDVMQTWYDYEFILNVTYSQGHYEAILKSFPDIQRLYTQQEECGFFV